MSAQTEIATILKALAPTTPFGVTNSARTRIVYQQASGGWNEHLTGVGPHRLRMQIDCYAEDPKSASVLAEQAKVALRAGAVISATYDNGDSFDDTTKLYGSGFDVAIWPKP